MYYSLVLFPEIDLKKINVLRKKYDPYSKLIDAHITIIFPVPDSVGEKKLIAHIGKILKAWKPFDIRLTGLEMAWDQWLFLVLEEGNGKVIKLHDQLYRGILASHLRKDIEFIPHIALGLFADEKKYDLRNPKKVPRDRAKYTKGVAEAKKMNFDYDCKVKTLTLVKVDDTFTKSQKIKEFRL